ncbi:MAG: metallophosphoesterase [Candidatus Eremiobacteraeota bacterium]|nr:metallophosphoesterase [Candidatus Eremiobacteraeota bacterium]
MQLTIPDFALVVLIGASGSGKSTFAARHFRETEILSSDRCRALVADNESDQSATKDAFDVLYAIAGKRLAARRLTVIDATNLRRDDRARGIALARKYHALPVAIALDVRADVAVERNRARPDRRFGARVVHEHVRMLRSSLRNLRGEGYRVVHVLDDPEQIAGVTIAREPLYNDKRAERGPFDVIGDVHGCHAELTALLDRLGYEPVPLDGRMVRRHPDGRRVVFVGDLVDRGPGIVETLRLAMDMVETGSALCVPGNHEMKLLRKLNGKNVNPSHGMAETLAQLDALPSAEREAFVPALRAFLDGLVSHYWLDGGKLVVAHAGLREEMHGRGSGAVREFALYGETTGETDEFGLPVRFDWASEYRGNAVVAYGHTPVPRPEWVNKTICVDTGCVYGGALTALRYPELETVSVAALRTYVEPVRPLAPSADEAAPAPPTAQQAADDVLDMADVSGKRHVATRYIPHVTIPAENAAAALEVMSRWCADPRWLIYLPPTMSPPETSTRENLLEHPDEAFAYFRKSGVTRVVLEEKHMGSRAVVVLARDADAARRRFGVETGERGVVLTRTGRPFFSDHTLNEALLERLSAALERSGFWTRFGTDWLCLDAELMPWSAKAQALVDAQYAPVGEAAVAGLDAAAAELRTAVARGVNATALLERVQARGDAALRYVDAFRRYVRPVRGVDDLVLAPFHLLATEGAVYDDRDHMWHVHTLAEICAADPQLLLATAYRDLGLDDEQQCADAVVWWQELTANGGEGIVVKPWTFVTRKAKGIVQPALKVRGREYLRIVYGPEYTLPDQLERLRERGLATKRRLALQEFSLGLEALHRFVEGAPLRAVHECIFGVLALESEPVDPRL